MKIDPYEELANAIILVAVKDYRECLQIIKKYPRDIGTRNKALSIERFFRSNYFAILSNANPETIINGLKEEVSLS